MDTQVWQKPSLVVSSISCYIILVAFYDYSMTILQGKRERSHAIPILANLLNLKS